MKELIRERRNIDFGFNYLPFIGLVEDFHPYWTENKCTFEHMKHDLLTMRSLHARFVRFHLMPANPKRDCMPGIDPAEVEGIINQAVTYASDLGMRIHYDIWSDNILNITADEVKSIVGRFKGVVESYQIGNEPYFCWPRSDEYYEHTIKLIAAAKEKDEKAKFSIDIFPERA